MQEFLKHAEKIGRNDIEKYAAVVVVGNELYGFFNISDNDNFQKSVEKIAMDAENYPDEVRSLAMGIMNTEYVNKTGSAWPLFLGIPMIDTNVINISEINEVKKVASNSDGYLMGNGVFLPLDTSANIDAAGNLLNEYASRFDGIERVKFAQAIVKAADKLKVAVHDKVAKYASPNLNPDFYKLIDERIKFAESYPETINILKKIKSESATMTPDKVAEQLLAVDRMLPFSMKLMKNACILGSDRPRLFSSINVPDAYETAFGVNERPLKLHEKISCVGREKLAEYFSDVFIDRLLSNPERVIDGASPEVVLTLEEIASGK